MKDTDFIGNRAMNDYTSNINGEYKSKDKFIEPKKSAICLWSDSPMETRNKSKKKNN